ncbi:MAG: hypothetical protein AAFN11_22615, partial [Chloroflexota bacterium]
TVGKSPLATVAVGGSVIVADGVIVGVAVSVEKTRVSACARIIGVALIVWLGTGVAEGGVGVFASQPSNTPISTHILITIFIDNPCRIARLSSLTLLYLWRRVPTNAS